jgi:hypothetical protein
MLGLGAYRRSSPRAVARRFSIARTALCLAALLVVAGLGALAAPPAALALAPGDLLWLQPYAPAGLGVDRGSAVAVGDGGMVYAAGTLGAAKGNDSDIVLVARAADGSFAWATPYDGPGHGPDVATSMAVSPAGAVYVAGQATRAGSRDLVVLKFSSAGELLWQRFIGGASGPDKASALVLDRSGNVLVAGWYSRPGSRADAALAKYTPGGKRLWLRTWDGAAHRTDKAVDVAVDRSGNAVVVGSTALAHGSQTAALLLKYSAAGQLLWMRRQSRGAHGDALLSVALDAKGAVYAGGHTRFQRSGVDGLLVKYSAAGSEGWKWVVTSRQDGRDEIADVTVDDGGWVHGVGSTVALGTHPDGLVVSLAPTGRSRRLKTYDGGGYLADVFDTIACDAAGDVLVGGFTTSAAGIRSAVVAQYTRDLSQRLWLTAYKGTADSGSNQAASLALAPDTVFAAGTVVDTGTGSDLALAKLQR